MKCGPRGHLLTETFEFTRKTSGVQAKRKTKSRTKTAGQKEDNHCFSKQSNEYVFLFKMKEEK
jgi:hypothetical protein